MNKKYEKIFDKHGWNVHRNDEFCIDINKDSPAGENIRFRCFQTDDFAKRLKVYSDNFDVDAHAEIWIPSRGKNGVPPTLRELIEDAEAICQMIKELAADIEKADVGEYEEEDSNSALCGSILDGISFHELIENVSENILQPITEEAIFDELNRLLDVRNCDVQARIDEHIDEIAKACKKRQLDNIRKTVCDSMSRMGILRYW